MKLRKLLTIMNPFDNIEILSIHDTDRVLFQGEIGDVPFFLTECDICVDEEALDFCHICAETLVVYVDD